MGHFIIKKTTYGFTSGRRSGHAGGIRDPTELLGISGETFDQQIQLDLAANAVQAAGGPIRKQIHVIGQKR